MLSHHELYNSLPSLHDARTRLEGLKDGPQHLLESLAPLFKFYPHLGMCLVHSHCELAEGEKMVSSGRVSQPERGVDGYPERWLANGTPYEFSRTPTIEGEGLPPALVKNFEGRLVEYGKSIGEKDLSGLLGIYFVHDPDALHAPAGESKSQARDDVIWMERTEGRVNTVEPVPREEAAHVPNAVPAAWYVVTKKSGEIEEKEGTLWELVVLQGCSCVDTGEHGIKWRSQSQSNAVCQHCWEVKAHHCRRGAGGHS
jgi:hypothetical protein